MLPRPLITAARVCKPAAAGSAPMLLRAVTSSARASVRCCSSAPAPPPHPQAQKARAPRGLSIAGNVNVHIDTLNVHLANPTTVPAPVAHDTASQAPVPPHLTSKTPTATNVTTPTAPVQPSSSATYSCVDVLKHPPSYMASHLALSTGSHKAAVAYDKSDGWESGDKNGLCMLWDLQQPPGQTGMELLSKYRTSFAVAMSSNAQRVVAAGSSGVCVWDAGLAVCRSLQLQLQPSKELEHKQAEGNTSGAGEQGKEEEAEGEEEEDWDEDDMWATAVALTGNGRYAAAWGERREYGPSCLRVWDLEDSSPHPMAIVELPGDSERRVVALAISADGSCVTAIDNLDRVWRWEVGKGLSGPLRLEGAGCFSHSSISVEGWTAVACRGMDVQVWDLATGTLTATLEGHTNYVLCTCISPDGRLAVSGGRDHTVRVWDLQSRSCIATLLGHNTNVGHVAISPEGSCVVSAGFGALRVWRWRP